MPLNTEVFVMIIFIAGLPFYYGLLRDSDLNGSSFFLLAYIFLLLSNIFTVIEEFWLNYFFNICEHLFITLSAIMFIIAIYRLTSVKVAGNIKYFSDTVPGQKE